MYNIKITSDKCPCLNYLNTGLKQRDCCSLFLAQCDVRGYVCFEVKCNSVLNSALACGHMTTSAQSATPQDCVISSDHITAELRYSATMDIFVAHGYILSPITLQNCAVVVLRYWMILNDYHIYMPWYLHGTLMKLPWNTSKNSHFKWHIYEII